MAVSIGKRRRSGWRGIRKGRKREKEREVTWTNMWLRWAARLAQVMIGSRGWPTLDRSTDRDLESQKFPHPLPFPDDTRLLGVTRGDTSRGSCFYYLFLFFFSYTIDRDPRRDLESLDSATYRRYIPRTDGGNRAANRVIPPGYDATISLVVAQIRRRKSRDTYTRL